MPKYKIDKKEAVEGIIEENLFSQPFMVEMFGTDIEYELDHDTSPDTDEARNPILKQHILVEIQASKQTIELVGAILDDFEIGIKKWLKQYGLESYFDATYTSDDYVTISIDVPEQDDPWSPEKYAAKGLEIDGSYIPRLIMGALDKLKGAQDLPASVLQEMSDKVVDEIRGAGADNINESYVFVDFLEKLAGEVRNSIKGETIDHIKTTNDNTGLGNTLTVVDTPVIQYSEDKTYAEIDRQVKKMKMALDARAKTIKKEVYDAIDAGNESPVAYVITSAIRPKPSRAKDGKDLGKITVSFYKWGKYQGEEEIDEKDLTTMVQLGQYELDDFDIRDEDIDKTFYAEENDIDDTNDEEDGYGVKRAYAIEEDKAKNGKKLSFCSKGNYENIKSVSEIKKIVGSEVWKKFSNGDDERWNDFFKNDNGVVSIDIEDDSVYVLAKSTQKHSDDESSLQTYLAEAISNFCGIEMAANGKEVPADGYPEYTNGGGVGSLQEIESLIAKIKKAKYEWYDLENEEDQKMFDLFEKYSGLTGVDDLYGLLAFKFSGIKGIKDLDTAKEYVSENGPYEVFDFKKAVKFIEEVISLSKQNPSNSIPSQIQKEMENAISGKTLPADTKYVFVADAWDGWLGDKVPSMKTFKDWDSASRSYKKFLEDSNFNQGEWQMGLYKCEPGKNCKIYTENNVQKVRNSKKVHEFDYMEALVKSVQIGKSENFVITFEKEEFRDGGQAADGKKLREEHNKNVSKGKEDGYPEYKANFENALFKKYGVMIGDTGIEDSSIKEAFDKNENVDNLVNYLGEKHQITPVAAQGTAVEIKSPVKSKSATSKSYICIIKDRFGKEIGSYELDYADDDYVSTFLSAIGVRLKAGDTKEIVEA